jgi:hypothetical protein
MRRQHTYSGKKMSTPDSETMTLKTFDAMAPPGEEDERSSTSNQSQIFLGVREDAEGAMLVHHRVVAMRLVDRNGLMLVEGTDGTFTDPIRSLRKRQHSVCPSAARDGLREVIALLCSGA